MQMKFYDFNPYRKFSGGKRKNVQLSVLTVCALVFNVFPSHALVLADNKPINKEIKNLAPITVKGKVLDDQGLPLPGASVTVKGKNQATSTNIDGEFTLTGVEENSIIVISSIGFKTQEVTAKSNLNIRLIADVSKLNEVIVVGYGKQSKKDLTSSVTQISGDAIRTTPAANVQNMLAGKVVGLTTQQQSGQPGVDGTDFYLRGVSTEVGNNKPLVLIDDVESDYDQVSKIDPSEIESISFLKDAGSTAIYGIKGANGVMLVTTKRGKIGAPKFTFGSQFALQRQIKPVQYLDSYQTALFYNEALRNEAKLGNSSFPLFTDDDLQKFKDGSDPYMHPNVDWYDALFKKASIMTDNNLSVSGGNEKVKYFTSLGYLFQNGILKDFEATDYYGGPVDANNNFYYKRYNFRSNLDINATKNLLIKVDLSGNTDVRNQPSSGSQVFNQVNSFKTLPPWMYNIYNPNGSYGFTNSSNGRSPEGYSTLPNNIVGNLALGGYNRQFSTQLNANVSAVQNLDMITPGLKIRGLFGYTNIDRAQRNLNRAGTFPSFQYDPVNNTYIPRDPNVFSIAPLAVGTDVTVATGGSNGYISPLNRLNLQANLNYDKSIGDHNISVLALYSSSSQTVVRNDQLVNRIPDKLAGYTYRLSYNYKHKYLLETSGAYNGSPKFTQRFGFFPSVGVGYNISDEPFWKKALPAINDFKIRGSVGIVGADDLGRDPDGNPYAYTYRSIYKAGGTTYFGDNPNASPGIYEGNLGKDNITWQKELKKDLSIDFGVFKSKVFGTVSVFDNLRYDILYKRSTIPIFYGIASPPPQNIGRVSNKGIEVELNYASKIGNLGFTIGTKYSFIKNKLLEFDEAPAQYPWLQRTGQALGVRRYFLYDGFYDEAQEATIHAESAAIKAAIANKQPVPQRTIPIPSGPDPLAGFIKFKDLNGDGIINDLDAPYTGKPNLPQSNLAFNLGLNYKNFSFAAIFQSAFDYNLALTRDSSDPLYSNLTVNDLNYWTPERGNSATRIIPLLEYTKSNQSAGNNGSLTSTFYNIDAYYIRLRNVSLSYNLSDKLTSKLGLGKSSIFLNGSNLFTISNVYDRYSFDPEVATGTGSAVYPIQKIFNFGVNISF